MTHILQLQNVNSWLVTKDKDLKSEISGKLRFRDDNYYHVAAYKNGKWDGFQQFFNEKNGLFLTGLLPEVMSILKKLNQTYKIVDERANNVKWIYKSIDENFLNQWLPDGFKKITLHDYQPDLVNKAIFFNRGIIQAPTASGKTFCLISILKCLPPKTPVLFLTKNVGLVHQNYEEMIKWKIPNVGRWYGKHKEPNFITCANVNKHSLKGIDKLLKKFKVLIVDEVHECMSEVPVAAYTKMTNACIRFGISATPFKDEKIHKHTVKGHFGPIFKTSTTDTGYLTTKDLQQRGILSSTECVFYKIKEPTNIIYEPYIDSVTLGIAENYYFHKVIKRLSLSLTGRTLILVERRDQGEYLQQLIPNAHWINGDDDVEKTRKPVINALRSAENVIAIVMRQIITAGIDIMIHNLINAAGGDADYNVIQQIGRGLRCASDKDGLKYRDFIFETNDYLEKHSHNRIKTLKAQGHEVVIKNEFDF